MEMTKGSDVRFLKAAPATSTLTKISEVRIRN